MDEWTNCTPFNRCVKPGKDVVFVYFHFLVTVPVIGEIDVIYYSKQLFILFILYNILFKTFVRNNYFNCFSFYSLEIKEDFYDE